MFMSTRSVLHSLDWDVGWPQKQQKYVAVSSVSTVYPELAGCCCHEDGLVGHSLRGEV